MVRRARKSQLANPALVAFGNQVRFYRERLGLSQERLGERFPVSGSYIGLVEGGKTRCTEEFAEHLDGHLEAHGALLRLWNDLVKDAPYPTWFDWPVIEAEAVELVAWEISVVYGLLQTPEYAAALLGDNAKVEGRLSRQTILTRPDPAPPTLAVLMDESVLRRDIGGAKVMSEQLQHLIDVSSRGLTVQVVPHGLHDGLSGSCVLATMDDRSQIAYVDTAVRGLTMSGKEEIGTLSQALTSLRANAYSVRETQEIIRKVVHEKWT
ncbi:helix-turn-helix domain-containing protein [Actinomadura parmotrematis]|uniref:Helix-turn-helix domain-containing protein n=1 Tax=Actinomadura parmotrematis TaxID=2864039 RepID=A0ABS7FVW4_9ACTN|nr:helix-turn-helix transcriptional regulator [Actinomadura parmotrematis]MBW8484563.1 helix-turn-helix domain-containing protein [Actinomadura parmotrematis]